MFVKCIFTLFVVVSECILQEKQVKEGPLIKQFVYIVQIVFFTVYLINDNLHLLVFEYT